VRLGALTLLRQAFADHGWRPGTATKPAPALLVPVELATVPPPVSIVPVEPAPPRPPAPPHPLQQLADLVHARLRAIGAATHLRGLDVEPRRAAPLAQWSDDRVTLAGDSDALRAIELVRIDDSPWASAAIDGLTAHVVTVLNVALTTVTDVAELHALGRLLE